MLYRQNLIRIQDEFYELYDKVEKCQTGAVRMDNYFSFLVRYVNNNRVPITYKYKDNTKSKISAIEKSIVKWIKNSDRDLDGFIVSANNAFVSFVHICHKKYENVQ